MGFNLIDMDKWDRTKYFIYFTTDAKSSCNITNEIDITNLLKYVKKESLKFYPSMICLVSKVINSQINFKLSYDSQMRLGYFDEVSPDYAILKEGTHEFVSITTQYNEDMQHLYKDIISDMDKYKNSDQVLVNHKESSFVVSCTPWISYTSLGVTCYYGEHMLMPFTIWGKYFQRNGRTILPLTFIINHAAADGWHIGEFYRLVQEYCENPKSLFKE